jgi:hypothetical protein
MYKKKEYEIVVARYNEDISWLLPYSPITIIYNKGNDHPILNQFHVIQLPNIGRESHTYLYHIIQNYDHLAEKTIFFQGKINDHKTLEIKDYFGKDNFIGNIKKLKIDKMKENIKHFDKWKEQYISGDMKKCNYVPYYWMKHIIGIDIKDDIIESGVVWGANFSVSKKAILSKPKIFYENILRYLIHKNPEEGHYMERSWYMIFHYPISMKNKKIGYLLLKDSNDYKKTIDKIKDKIDHFDEIHLWIPMKSNFEVGLNHPIHYIHSNTKYCMIKPEINNNTFRLMIKWNVVNEKDTCIKVELENNKIYNIIFSNDNMIRIEYDNKRINSSTYHFEKKIFNEFEFVFLDEIIIKQNENILLQTKNEYNTINIKNIFIKGNKSTLWEYNNISKLKNYVSNNYYKDDLNEFYSENNMDSYIIAI